MVIANCLKPSPKHPSSRWIVTSCIAMIFNSGNILLSYIDKWRVMWSIDFGLCSCVQNMPTNRLCKPWKIAILLSLKTLSDVTGKNQNLLIFRLMSETSVKNNTSVLYTYTTLFFQAWVCYHSPFFSEWNINAKKFLNVDQVSVSFFGTTYRSWRMQSRRR